MSGIPLPSNEVFHTFYSKFSEAKEEVPQLLPQFVSCFPHEVVPISELRHLPEWLNEIARCRAIFKKALPEPAIEEGDAVGILYKVRKDGKTKGYLFGSLHYPINDELASVMNLHPSIQKKLLRSMIFCTEVRMASIPIECMEKKLYELALKQGIVNFGIDCDTRNTFSPEGETIALSKEDCEELSELARHYKKGDQEKIRILLEKGEEEHPCCNKRNGEIAKKIDAFLLPFPEGERGFFALGTAHLITTKKNKSVTDFLKDEGWELELISS